MKIYYPTANSDRDQLTERLNQKFRCAEHHPASVNRTYYDSFDWRLFKDGKVLFAQRNTLNLTDRIFSADGVQASIRKKPAGSDSLPEGPLKEAIDPLLEMRRLLPLFTTHHRQIRLDILNQDAKTVCRLTEHQMESSANKQKIALLAFQPLRGYSVEARAVEHILRECGFVRPEDDPFVLVCRMHDLEPGAYSSKVHITLQPDMPAREALVKILLFLHGVMVQNLQGIIEDWDTEFLHDFRVSIRRTRSALSQIKEVFPGDDVNYFKEEFKWLGKLSNQLRDLDVYLLSESRYRKMLPDALRGGLDALFRDLRRRRGARQRHFRDALQKERAHTLLDDWYQFLTHTDHTGEDAAAQANHPIIRVADRVIMRRFKKVLKAGNQIDKNSPDEELHRLRIQCKKLRYLLEFFSSLYPAGNMNQLIKQLKKLQDNLGSFNDYSFQQIFLHAYLDEKCRRKSCGTDTAAAVGGLISQLYHQQQSVRQQFRETFSAFAGPENRNLFKQTFALRAG